MQAKHVQPAEPLTTDFKTNKVPHASTGYVGLVEDTWKRLHTLEELTGPKYSFAHRPWQGRYMILWVHSSLCSPDVSRIPTPIMDSEGRVMAVMAGQPDDPQWPELAEQAANTLEEL